MYHFVLSFHLHVCNQWALLADGHDYVLGQILMYHLHLAPSMAEISGYLLQGTLHVTVNL